MRALAFIAAALVTTATNAQVSFLSYNGPVKAWKAASGFKEERDGIDFWMSGQPDIDYTIVGFVKDQRACDYPWAAKQVSYREIAKVAKQNAFDGLILLPAEARQVRVAPPSTDEQPTTWEEALRQRGLLAENGRTVLSGPLPAAIRDQLDKTSVIDLGTAPCGENRFVAVHYQRSGK